MDIPTAGKIAGKGGVFWSVESCSPLLHGLLGESEEAEISGGGGTLLPFQQILRRYVDMTFVKNTHTHTHTHTHTTL